MKYPSNNRNRTSLTTKKISKLFEFWTKSGNFLEIMFKDKEGIFVALGVAK